MDKVLDSLESAIAGARFLVDGNAYSHSTVRNWYRNRDRRDVAVNFEHIDLKEKSLRDLVQVMKCRLRGYTNKKTGQIGNGLFLVLGGTLGNAYMDVSDFAKMLVVASAKIGPQRVAGLFSGWVKGVPLRTKEYVLFEGITVSGPITCRGLSIFSQDTPPPNSLDLPITDPMRHELIVGVREVDVAPAIYMPSFESPTDIEPNPWKQPCLQNWPHIDPATFWDRRCEAMSLALGSFVGWRTVWPDWEELNAFTVGRHASSIVKGNFRAFRRNTDLSRELLEESMALEEIRSGAGTRRLDLAIHRWRESHLGTLEDQLIELRIALEAIYADGRDGVRATVASRCAWHLGETYEERRAYNDAVSKVYRDASRVVHAGTVKYANQDESVVSQCRNACRAAILKILKNGMPCWTELTLGRSIEDPPAR